LRTSQGRGHACRVQGRWHPLLCQSGRHDALLGCRHGQKEETPGEKFTFSQDASDKQTVGKYLVTTKGDLVLVHLTDTAGASEGEKVEQNKKPVAFFSVPAQIQTLQCAGDKIVVGCQNGAVLRRRAQFLVQREQHLRSTFDAEKEQLRNTFHTGKMRLEQCIAESKTAVEQCKQQSGKVLVLVLVLAFVFFFFVPVPLFPTFVEILL